MGEREEREKGINERGSKKKLRKKQKTKGIKSPTEESRERKVMNTKN